MNSLTIWHNPRCSKSRQTLALIENSGQNVYVRRYLDETPSSDDIRAILVQLGLTDPRAIMRKGEAVYKALSLSAETRPERLIAAMVKHPILIERPIVSDGLKAIIGRPPEAVMPLLKP